MNAYNQLISFTTIDSLTANPAMFFNSPQLLTAAKTTAVNADELLTVNAAVESEACADIAKAANDELVIESVTHDTDSASVILGELATTKTETAAIEADEVMSLSTESAFNFALSKMISDRTDWEQNELVRSNEKLYSILQGCYAVYQSMNGVNDVSKSNKKIFDAFCKNHSITFKSNTHLMFKIVKCVFGNDQRRVSNYALALRIAAERNVPKDGIKTFFKSEGGVEEVRRKESTRKTLTERSEKGKSVLTSEVLATVSSLELDLQFDATSNEDAVILLATRNANGNFEIHKVVQNGTAIKAVLASLSSSVIAGEQTQKTVNDAESRQKLCDDAINESLVLAAA